MAMCAPHATCHIAARRVLTCRFSLISSPRECVRRCESVRDVRLSRTHSLSRLCRVPYISYFRPYKSRMVRAPRAARPRYASPSLTCAGRPPSPPPRQLVSALPVCHSRNGRGRRSRSVPSPDAHWRWGGACNVFGCTHPRQPQAGPSWASRVLRVGIAIRRRGSSGVRP